MPDAAADVAGEPADSRSESAAAYRDRTAGALIVAGGSATRSEEDQPSDFGLLVAGVDLVPHARDGVAALDTCAISPF